MHEINCDTRTITIRVINYTNHRNARAIFHIDFTSRKHSSRVFPARSSSAVDFPPTFSYRFIPKKMWTAQNKHVCLDDNSILIARTCSGQVERIFFFPAHTVDSLSLREKRIN